MHTSSSRGKPVTETLNGFIERVTYHNPENGFAVLRVKIKGRDELVSVVGNTTSNASAFIIVAQQTMGGINE